jgi:hypothetical protein
LRQAISAAVTTTLSDLDAQGRWNQRHWKAATNYCSGDWV